MNMPTFAFFGLVLVSVFAGCSREISQTDTSGFPTSSGVGTTGGQDANTFILDFSGSKNGGLEFGGRENVALTIDTTVSVRTYAFQADMFAPQVGPGVDARNDFGSCPMNPAPDHVAMLGPGVVANVLSIDLDMLNVGETKIPTGNICFGYRDPQGTWHWDAGTVAVSYDSIQDRFKAHLPIDKGMIDALLLNTDWGPRPLRTLSYVVAP